MNPIVFWLFASAGELALRQYGFSFILYAPSHRAFKAPPDVRDASALVHWYSNTAPLPQVSSFIFSYCPLRPLLVEPSRHLLPSPRLYRLHGPPIDDSWYIGELDKRQRSRKLRPSQ